MESGLVIELKTIMQTTVYFVGLTPAEKKKLSNKLGGGPEMNSHQRQSKTHELQQGRHNSWIEELLIIKEEGDEWQEQNTLKAK